MKNPNCHQCKHRGSIPGDAHSCCNHPIVKSLGVVEQLIVMCGGTVPAIEELNIQLDPYGVKQGWACWPLNFDCVWLKNCDGFELINT